MSALAGPTRAAARQASALVLDLCRSDRPPPADACLFERLAAGEPRRVLLDFAGRHRLTGLCLAALERAGVVGELERRGDTELAELGRWFGRRAAVFALLRDRVLRVLDGAGVRTVVLKGACLASTLYDDPVERELEDLDLLVAGPQLKTAVRILQREGYNGPASLRRLRIYRRHHFHFHLEQSARHSVEVHWALSAPRSPFQLDPAAVLAGARPVEAVGTRAFLAPRPEHLLLHVVLQNLQEGFSRLARLVDVDRIVRRAADLDWALLCATARSGNLGDSTALTLQLARRLLGTAVPAGVTDELRPQALARVHLSLLSPITMLLTQRTQRTHAARDLLELWLSEAARARLLRPGAQWAGDAFAEAARRQRIGLPLWLLRFAKLGLLQVFLYLRAAAVQLTPAGRLHTRFWSSQAKSSDRL